MHVKCTRIVYFWKTIVHIEKKKNLNTLTYVYTFLQNCCLIFQYFTKQKIQKTKP